MSILNSGGPFGAATVSMTQAEYLDLQASLQKAERELEDVEARALQSEAREVVLREALEKGRAFLDAFVNEGQMATTAGEFADALRALSDQSASKVKAVLKRAERLSAAMCDAEAKGADFELIDKEWQELTVALDNYRSGEGR